MSGIVKLGELSWKQDSGDWIRTDGTGGDAASGSPFGVALSEIERLQDVVLDLASLVPPERWKLIRPTTRSVVFDTQEADR